MSDAIQCPQCGRQYSHSPQLAGQTLLCVGCGGAIDVPAEQPAVLPPGAITCGACGASYLANPILAGQQIGCPACQQPIQVPGEEFEDDASPAASPEDLEPGLQLAPLDDTPRSAITSPPPPPAAKPAPPEDSDLQLAPIEELDNPRRTVKPLTSPRAPSSILTPLEPAAAPPMPGLPISAIPVSTTPAALTQAAFFDEELRAAQTPREERRPPPARGKSRRKRRRRDRSAEETFVTRTLVPTVGGIGFLVGLATAARSHNFFVGLYYAFLIYHVTANLALWSGFVWGLISAFNDEPVQGILYFFVPFYCLFYNYQNRDEEPHPYQLMFGALAFWGAVIVLHLALYYGVLLYLQWRFGGLAI